MNGILAMAISSAQDGKWWPDTWIGRVWVIFGLCAQLIFGARFYLQWIVSERRGESYIPLAFWYLSIVGGVMLFMYSVHERALPFAIGQATGVFVYVRNIMLRSQEKHQQRQVDLSEPSRKG